MGEDHRVLQGDSVRGGEVAHPLVGVADDGGKVGRRASLAGRMAVPALIPGEHGDILQSQRRDGFLPAPRVFMSAVEKEQRFGSRFLRQPGPVKQFGAVT